tara:strand:- start:1242 stop:1364 length:123 start_codon:yes stop_codon:yes gene_type:complete
MREIILSSVVAVVIAFAAYYLLDGMAVDTASALSGSAVRL